MGLIEPDCADRLSLALGRLWAAFCTERRGGQENVEG